MLKKIVVLFLTIFICSGAMFTYAIGKSANQNVAKVRVLQTQIKSLKDQITKMDKAISVFQASNNKLGKDHVYLKDKFNETMAKLSLIGVRSQEVPLEASFGLRVNDINKIYYNGNEIPSTVCDAGEIYLSSDYKEKNSINLQYYSISILELEDIFNKTMRWDAENRAIYFEDKK